MFSKENIVKITISQGAFTNENSLPLHHQKIALYLIENF